MADQFRGQSPLERKEHNESASAKRVVPYGFNGSAYVSQAFDLIAKVDYDYLDVQQTDSDTETFVFKLGGSGGTTVRTIVVNYTDSNKTDIDNVAWS